MAGKQFLQFHLLPFSIALIVMVVFLFSPFSSYFVAFDKGEIHSRNFQQTYKPKFPPHFSYNDLSGSFSEEQEVMNYWMPQRPVVVFGSSEITHSELAAIPYNFFSHYEIPCIGIGHSGNQSLCILTQLALMHNFLDSMRLVIILSPGWFIDHASNGTPLETFLEYNDEHFLYYLENDRTIPANVKNEMDAYVANHFNEIDAPSSILRKMAYRHIALKSKVHLGLYAIPIHLLSMYCEDKQKRMDEFFLDGKSPKPFSNPWNELHYLSDVSHECLSVNWDSLMNQSLKDFRLTCTNNAIGVENNYYNQWMKGKPLRIITPVGSEKNQEFQDLVLLLSYLKTENCKPLIVMQPYNPLCFENLPAMDPILTEIREAVKKNGFEYLDLMTMEKKNYKIGMLSDYQHFGDYGWYLVDQKINSYFFQSAHEK